MKQKSLYSYVIIIMLVIRETQMQVFDDYAFQQFIDDMVIELRNDYPTQTAEMPEKDLRKMIEDGTNRAEIYDVTMVSDVQRFLGCMLLLGQNFDTEDQTVWAGKILRDKDMSGTLKMDEIDDQLNFRSVEKV